MSTTQLLEELGIRIQLLTQELRAFKTYVKYSHQRFEKLHNSHILSQDVQLKMFEEIKDDIEHLDQKIDNLR